MRKDLILPGLALAGGAAGFALRWWQLASAYRPEEKLFLHGAPATLALLGVLGAALLILALLTWKVGRRPEGFLDAFACPQAGQMTLLAAAGLLMAVAGLLGLGDAAARMNASDEPLSNLTAQAVTCLLALPGGLGLLQMAPFPALTGLGWLFATHLRHGSEPVLMTYGFGLAAAGLLMLAHYYAAGFFFGRSKPRRTVFCALAGVSLGLTALADRPAWWEAALTLAFVLSALAFARALLLPRPAPEAPAAQS